jgi:hypothetical protein
LIRTPSARRLTSLTTSAYSRRGRPPPGGALAVPWRSLPQGILGTVLRIYATCWNYVLSIAKKVNKYLSNMIKWLSTKRLNVSKPISAMETLFR